MSAVHSFHALRELALAGAITPADTLAAWEALAELGKLAGLAEEARTAAAIAAGLRGEETMELMFRDLLNPEGEK
jgi:hypothetical protein